jgi:hypothetical protein
MSDVNINYAALLIFAFMKPSMTVLSFLSKPAITTNKTESKQEMDAYISNPGMESEKNEAKK